MKTKTLALVLSLMVGAYLLYSGSTISAQTIEQTNCETMQLQESYPFTGYDYQPAVDYLNTIKSVAVALEVILFCILFTTFVASLLAPKTNREGLLSKLSSRVSLIMVAAAAILVINVIKVFIIPELSRPMLSGIILSGLFPVSIVVIGLVIRTKLRRELEQINPLHLSSVEDLDSRICEYLVRNQKNTNQQYIDLQPGAERMLSHLRNDPINSVIKGAKADELSLMIATGDPKKKWDDKDFEKAAWESVRFDQYEILLPLAMLIQYQTDRVK